MPPRKMKKSLLPRIDVPVTELQDEYIARASWEFKQSKAQFMRSSLPVNEELKIRVNQLRTKQKGIKGILRPSLG